MIQADSWMARATRKSADIARKPILAARALRQTFAYYGSPQLVARKAWRAWQQEGWRGLWRRARAVLQMADAADPQRGWAGLANGLFVVPPPLDGSFLPLVTVIVPNFNHVKYLRARLDSIYRQDYDRFEVILLDDASSDDSVQVLREYAERHASKTSLHVNEANSGGVFHQWKKGLSLARGELIWIAESDDYCEPTHLSELVRFFRNEAVTLAFCRSEFVRGEECKTEWSTDEALADCLGDLVRQPFIQSAHRLVNNAWGKKNLVVNASSAVFRHPGALPLLQDEAWTRLRLCGDWIFYLHLVRGGLVGYTPQTTNYYRQHGEGTSFQIRQRDTYYSEFEAVAHAVLKLYRIDTEILASQQQALYVEWCAARGAKAEVEFAQLYDLERVRRAVGTRSPNVLMAGFALIAGGGETFPVMLANLLRQQGVAVTFFNCRHVPTEPGVRKMLERGVPLVELDHLGRIGALCEELGVELVHSHHAWVDMTLAQCLTRQPGIRQVVSMHGMYEMMTPDALANVMPMLEEHIDGVVYTATKNLGPFSPAFQAEKHFTLIRNALTVQPVTPADRAALGMAEQDFVFCLVARAIPEKGWEEAIDAVERANLLGSRTIHLLLIGEGIESTRLAARASDRVHFLGFKSNIRDYYLMSDMGLLPSRFPGESAPLVLIDCLLAGRPLLASRIGEISDMLQGDGEPAGAVFDLEPGFVIPVEQLAQWMARLANEHGLYERAAAQVPRAAAKFDPLVMVRCYMDFYRDVLLTDDGRLESPQF